MLADHPDASDDRVFEIGFFPIGRELVFIRRSSGESQNVHADHVRIHLLERASLDHRMDAFTRADDEVMVALDADLEIFVQFLVEDQRLAHGTFRPKTGRDLALASFAGAELEFLFYE